MRRRIARARLAAQVIRRLRRAGVPDARYHARTFEIHFTVPGDDEPTILQLAPLLAERGRRGRSRRRILDEFVAGLLHSPELPADWADAAPLLRPVLRGAAPGEPLHRPVLPFLSEFVVADSPETITYVTRAQLETWSVSSATVFETARSQLTGAVLHGTATGPVVVRFVDDGNAYWTSHLLLQGWLARLSGQVGGVPVAFVPERGTLLVAADGSDHLPGLFAQSEAVFLTSPAALSPMAYVSDENGCTIPYPAPPGHPLHQTVRRAERVLAVQEYARQAAASPEPLPPLLLRDADPAGWTTRAIWEHDGPALLPEADEVQLGDRVVPWASLAPHLTRAEDSGPPRWVGRSWSL
ncbi:MULTISPECIES: hypothetical protein [Actinoplanes]|uniref:hypothetical protein n=1 Tax=Actinoplanes TaxID=1865 RepID=UPI001B805B3C|nr:MULTISPECIES: hypothetical protein [Actinoplanes]